MKYYIYILYSQSKDRYYTGYSSDPEERVSEHNAGATTSTRPGIPWILVFKEECTDRSAAIRRENEIKKMKSRKYIERLMSNYTVG